MEAAKSKAVKPERKPAREQDGAAKAAKSEAAKAEATMATADATEAETARLGAEAARSLVQARSSPLPGPPHIEPRTGHPSRMQPRTLSPRPPFHRCKWS